MKAPLWPSRPSAGNRAWLPRSAILVSYGVLVGAGVSLVATFGCNSGNDGDSPSRLARVERAAEEGVFRNLGKRSAFDYGSVEPGGGSDARR